MKKIIFAIFMMSAAGAFAEAAPSWIDFSTTGPDLYADGTQVLDNEVYALVWVANAAEFAGFNAKGELVDDAANKLICRAAVAKNGACPFIRYMLDGGNQNLPNGEFRVYLLDTRVKYEDGTAKAGVKNAGGTFVAVNGYEKVNAEIVKGGSVAVDKENAASGAGALATILPADVPQPVIRSFDYADGRVLLKVANTVPYVQYTVEGYTALGGEGTVVADGVNGKDGTVNLIVESPGDFRFFKVIRSK